MTSITADGTMRSTRPSRAGARLGHLASRLRPSRLAVNLILVGVSLFWLMPTVSLLIFSLRPESLFSQSGWWRAFVTPSQLTLHNYRALLSQGLKAGGVLDAVVTSAEITVPATILVSAIAALAAYSLVFGSWRGRNVVFLAIVGLMVVPLQIALIPVVQLYKGFGSVTGYNPYGTIPGVIVFHVAFGLPFGVFLMRNFFTGIPKDLLEAGRIEGAGEWVLFRRIVLPLGLPALASLAIFQFIWVWNDLAVALVYLGGNVHQPLTVFLYGQTRALAANYWIVATGGVISIVIPLIVFFSFQRYFVRGMLAGAVK